MLDRLLGFCVAVLAAAVAVYVAVKLIESVAAGLVIIGAVIGGLVIVSWVIRLVWRRGRVDRW